MSIRFGVSPIAWANDDMPELGGDTPLESILRDIQELGFEGVELGIFAVYPEPQGGRPSPKVRAFVDLLVAHFRANPIA